MSKAVTNHIPRGRSSTHACVPLHGQPATMPLHEPQRSVPVFAAYSPMNATPPWPTQLAPFLLSRLQVPRLLDMECISPPPHSGYVGMGRRGTTYMGRRGTTCIRSVKEVVAQSLNIVVLCTQISPARRVHRNDFEKLEKVRVCERVISQGNTLSGGEEYPPMGRSAEWGGLWERYQPGTTLSAT